MIMDKSYTSKEAKEILKNYVLEQADILEKEILEDREAKEIGKESLNYA